MDLNFDFLENIPLLITAKDINSLYLGMSKECARLLGWISAQECYGKSDFEIPCNSNLYAENHIQLDKMMLHNKNNLQTLQMHEYTSGWNLLLVERSPIIVDEKIVGVLTRGTNTANTSLAKSYFFLYSFDKKKFGCQQNDASYILNDSANFSNLTIKQEQCLFLLIRGKSIKQIGKILNKSKTTIEFHVEAIKNKFNCQSKTEVIEKAIDGNYMYNIPTSLSLNNFNGILS